jgi:hypothetical protein
MPHDFGRIAGLYKNLGFETAGAVVALRKSAAAKVLKGMDEEKVCVLVRSALELPIKEGELTSFLEPFGKEDAAFTSSETSPEAALLSAAVLWAIIEDQGALSTVAALAVATASLGNSRPSKADPELVPYAERALAAIQAKTANEAPTAIKASAMPNLEAQLAAIQKAGEANSFQQGWTPVKESLNALSVFAGPAYTALIKQTNALLNLQQRMENELRMQWWVVGGWSSDIRRPFSGLTPAEAGMRAGKELAALVSAPPGPANAPALLDLILERVAGGSAKKISLNAVATATPRDWRRSSLADVTSWPHATLTPISFAAAMAAESEDAPDWEPRFTRTCKVPVNIEMSVLDAALQVLRERMLRRLVK